MEPPCELRIIRVTWPRKDQYTEVQTAQDPIPLEYDGNAWVAELPAYPKVVGSLYGQLGVTLASATAVPCLLNANDEPFPLTLIHAPDGRDWWIEKGQWKKLKGSGYHDAPLSRHAGDARLRVGDYLIRLRISPTGFTGEEFETLLDEFRSGAWQLILDPMSPTRATNQHRDGGIDPAFLAAVATFIQHAGRAFDQPHRELREIRELQPIERVRPHAGTFRALAVRGAPRMVSGRGHAPSFNTPENRQLLTMCTKLQRTLNGLFEGAKGAANDFENRAKAGEQRAKEIERTIGLAKVDRRRLVRMIEELESDRSSYCLGVQRLLTQPPDGLVIHHVEHRVTKDVDRDKYGEVGFWSTLSMVNGTACSTKSYRFIFREDIELIKSVFRKGFIYQVAGNFRNIFKPETNRYGEWGKVEVLRLSNIDSNLERLISEQISSLKNRETTLAREDFQIRLNSKDTEEQRLDLAEALRSAERLSAAGIVWAEVTDQLKPLAQQVSNLVKRASGLGIQASRHAAFTGSMTYVLNPDYRSALAAFRRALEVAGLTTSQLEGLLRLEDLGILDLPIVYERWCLLRIVSVLREHFRLTPPPELRDNLLGCVTDRGVLSLRFEGDAIRRDLLLEYQPRLPREGLPEKQCPNPDFMLTVLPRNDDDAIDGNPHPNLVVDAKYKPFVPIEESGPSRSLVDELDELIGRKQYHEPGDHRVFVLHPGNGSDAAGRVADYCHFGGSHLVADSEYRKPWDQSSPDHRYGAVLLRPGVTDPLIRLILMHLYLGIDDSLGAFTTRSPSYPLICPACGGAEMTHEPPSGIPITTHTGRAQWCTGCGRMLVWNYSGGCGTHLFKLGGYWTFHETHPLNPYNIRCYHCGDYMSIPEEIPESDQSDDPHGAGVPSWP